MVRVGGGWDTLENYLTCHDPCRVTVFRKAGGLEDVVGVVNFNGNIAGRIGRLGSDNSNRYGLYPHV